MRYKEARIKKNMRCEDRRKRKWKTVVEKPLLRVSQICAYNYTPAQLRRACHKYVPTPVIGLSLGKSSHSAPVTCVVYDNINYYGIPVFFSLEEKEAYPILGNVYAVCRIVH